MCRIARFLYALIPLRRFRACLIRSHFAACRSCGPEAGRTEGWVELVRSPDWIFRETGYWPEIERRMREKPDGGVASKASAPVRPLAGFAAAAGGVLALAVLAVLFVGRPVPGPDTSAAGRIEAPRVEVLSAEIGGRLARSSVYQMKSASFIWFYPALRKE
jgi:hypothetical protein